MGPALGSEVLDCTNIVTLKCRWINSWEDLGSRPVEFGEVLFFLQPLSLRAYPKPVLSLTGDPEFCVLLTEVSVCVLLGQEQR